MNAAKARYKFRMIAPFWIDLLLFVSLCHLYADLTEMALFFNLMLGIGHFGKVGRSEFRTFQLPNHFGADDEKNNCFVYLGNRGCHDSRCPSG
jgi:hypothetical protein